MIGGEIKYITNFRRVYTYTAILKPQGLRKTGSSLHLGNNQSQVTNTQVSVWDDDEASTMYKIKIVQFCHIQWILLPSPLGPSKDPSLYYSWISHVLTLTSAKINIGENMVSTRHQYDENGKGK